MKELTFAAENCSNPLGPFCIAVKNLFLTPLEIKARSLFHCPCCWFYSENVHWFATLSFLVLTQDWQAPCCSSCWTIQNRCCCVSICAHFHWTETKSLCSDLICYCSCISVFLPSAPFPNLRCLVLCEIEMSKLFSLIHILSRSFALQKITERNHTFFKRRLLLRFEEFLFSYDVLLHDLLTDIRLQVERKTRRDQGWLVLRWRLAFHFVRPAVSNTEAQKLWTSFDSSDKRNNKLDSWRKNCGFRQTSEPSRTRANNHNGFAPLFTFAHWSSVSWTLPLLASDFPCFDLHSDFFQAMTFECPTPKRSACCETEICQLMTDHNQHKDNFNLEVIDLAYTLFGVVYFHHIQSLNQTLEVLGTLFQHHDDFLQQWGILRTSFVHLSTLSLQWQRFHLLEKNVIPKWKRGCNREINEKEMLDGIFVDPDKLVLSMEMSRGCSFDEIQTRDQVHSQMGIHRGGTSMEVLSCSVTTLAFFKVATATSTHLTLDYTFMAFASFVQLIDSPLQIFKQKSPVPRYGVTSSALSAARLQQQHDTILLWWLFQRRVTKPCDERPKKNIQISWPCTTDSDVPLQEDGVPNCPSNSFWFPDILQRKIEHRASLPQGKPRASRQTFLSHKAGVLEEANEWEVKEW